MANFAKIVATASDFSVLDSTFKIRLVNSSRSIDVTYTWICKTLRTVSFQYTQGTGANEQGTNALSAVAPDIANSSISSYMAVATASNAFQIEANEYGWTIEEVTGTGTTNISFVETPEVVPPKNFLLTGYTLAAGTIPCADIEVTMIQNGDGVAPFTWISPSNASTTLVAQIARQATNDNRSITIDDSAADRAFFTAPGVIIPQIFTSVLITEISVVTNTGGLDATVTAFVTNPDNVFTFTYSLDGSLFQSSNVFPNVVDGSYTLYVNDGFGCIVTKAFTVDTATSVERANANLFVSKANPLRWVQRGINKYQTLDNTLYRDEFYLGQYKPFWAQPYQTNDGIITNQFQSNYDSLTARILDCDDNLIETLTIDQKSDNIGVEDKRDCIAFNRGNDQTGLYFTSGNIYDPGTTDIIDTYELNGGLPEWGKVGNTVILTGSIVGSFVIKQVIFDSTVQANALIIDYVWTSGNQSEAVIAEITYNRQNYEVYEFDFDLSTLSIGVYYAQIIMEDSLEEYPDIVFDTDYFDVETFHDHTNFIEYSESKRTGIDYETGFVGRVRVRSLDAYSQMNPGGEIDQYTASEGELTTLKATATMEGTFYIELIPKGFVEKFNIIFKHLTVLVNGEQWTMSEFETIPYANASLKSLNITLSRNNYNESNTLDIDIDGDLGTINTESDNPILQ